MDSDYLSTNSRCDSLCRQSSTLYLVLGIWCLFTHFCALYLLLKVPVFLLAHIHYNLICPFVYMHIKHTYEHLCTKHALITDRCHIIWSITSLKFVFSRCSGSLRNSPPCPPRSPWSFLHLYLLEQWVTWSHISPVHAMPSNGIVARMIYRISAVVALLF